VADQPNQPQQGQDKDQPEGEQRQRQPLGHQVDPRTGKPMEDQGQGQGQGQGAEQGRSPAAGGNPQPGTPGHGQPDKAEPKR
jgi:hypothetical protein